MRRVNGTGTGDDIEARARWLIRQARRLGSHDEWSLLYGLEIALLTLARKAPLEDGRWSGLAFDVECRLGELEAISPYPLCRLPDRSSSSLPPRGPGDSIGSGPG